jgi:Uma2 family endonuclease
MDVVFDDDNVFQLDVLYVSAERTDEIVKERIEGAPDMAIEILSPSMHIMIYGKKKCL